MLILNANKFLATLLIALSCSLECFADIPSSKGENILALSTGLPSFLNGSLQLFIPINSTYGFGLGASTQTVFINHVFSSFRFYNSPTQSACIFIEQSYYINPIGEGNKKIGGIGIGISKSLEKSTLDLSVSITKNDTTFLPGLGSGIKITRKSGIFYGANLLGGFFPTFFLGISEQLTNPFSFEKTKSGEIRD